MENSFIADAIDRIREMSHDSMRKPEQEIAGRQFIYQPKTDSYEEVTPRRPKPRSAALGTVAALAAWLKNYTVPETAFVVVSPKKGIVARLDVEALDYETEEVSVPFFKDDLPPSGWMGYSDLLQYLDAQVGHVHEEEVLRAATKAMRTFRMREAVLTEQGPTVNVAMKDAKGVHEDVNLPKFCSIDLRVLTREYTETHRFRFDVIVGEDAQPRFRFLPMNREEAEVRAAEHAINDLRGLLGEQWLVVEGA